MSLHDPKFVYLGATTHADPSEFQKRQQARIAAAQRQRQQQQPVRIAPKPRRLT